MSWMTITTTRQDLYAAVWAEPVDHVAKRLGLSNVGLGKLCRRRQIPVPPRGYWARKEAGKTDPKPSLPLAHTGHEVIAISKWTEPTPPPSSLPTEVQALVDAEQDERARLTVTVTRRLRSPAVLAAREALRLAKPDDRGIVRTPKHLNLLDIRVAPGSVRRALTIVETWLDACVARGYPVETGTAEAPRAQVLGTWFTLRLFERATIVKAPTPAQLAAVKRRHPYRDHREVFAPTGRLHLALVERCWDVHEWKDAAHEDVEAHLNDVIVAMIQGAQTNRVKAAQDAVRRDRAALVTRMRERQAARVTKLTKAAQDYRAFRELELFVEALTTAVVQDAADPAMRRLARWARLYVAEQNPLRELRRARARAVAQAVAASEADTWDEIDEADPDDPSGGV